MKSAPQIIFAAQAILGAWLKPGVMKDREALDQLVDLLEGPDALALAIAHGRIPAETEAQADVARFLVRRANR